MMSKPQNYGRICFACGSERNLWPEDKYCPSCGCSYEQITAKVGSHASAELQERLEKAFDRVPLESVKFVHVDHAGHVYLADAQLKELQEKLDLILQAVYPPMVITSDHNRLARVSDDLTGITEAERITDVVWFKNEKYIATNKGHIYWYNEHAIDTDNMWELVK
jgi:hypothetical protein